MKKEKQWALVLGIIAAVISITVGTITIVEKAKNAKQKKLKSNTNTPEPAEPYHNAGFAVGKETNTIV